MRKEKLVLNAAVVLGLIFLAGPSWADDTAQLKEQVQALQDKVDQLEGELSQRQPIPQPAVMPIYDQWADPFLQMAQMQNQMERNMRQALVDTGAFAPRMDMKQTDKNYIITMDIPGMDKDKIDVQVKQEMLIISGERRSESDNNTNSPSNQYYRQERSFGTFTQAIPLPDDAQKDRIDAKYKNGVLTVTVARIKKQDAGSDSQKITVN